jgi:hypothetical protein
MPAQEGTLSKMKVFGYAMIWTRKKKSKGCPEFSRFTNPMNLHLCALPNDKLNIDSCHESKEVAKHVIHI